MGETNVQVSIDADVWRAFRFLALELDISAAEYVRQVIAKEVEKAKKAKKAVKADKA